MFFRKKQRRISVDQVQIPYPNCCTVVGDGLPYPEKNNTIYIGKTNAFLKIYGGKATIVGDVDDVVSGIEHSLRLALKYGDRGHDLYGLGCHLPFDDIEQLNPERPTIRIGFGSTYFQVQNGVASVVGADCDENVKAILPKIEANLAQSWAEHLLKPHGGEGAIHE